jgi:hypothetical protein
MELEEVDGKTIEKCEYNYNNAKIVLEDGTILEFEMHCDGDPPILDVYLTKPGKERKLY